MKILILNLPSKEPITRRYMCSSYASGYIFPPQELLTLAGIAKGTTTNVMFVDAVAQALQIDEVTATIKNFEPNVVLSITSFEFYDRDVAVVNQIKSQFPNLLYGLIGHYPTVFPEETLTLSLADFIILGEPDHIFQQMLSKWQDGNMPLTIPGTVVKSHNGTILNNQPDRRIPNPNMLQMPAYEMLIGECYREPFMPSPVGVIQTARGCPYHCNYCVHSFGTKLTVLTPENVLEHIVYLKKVHAVKALRFIDDTFTAIPSRVIKICKLMIEKQVDLPWTCLSRADTLNKEMLNWMKLAGCVRLNVGMESGSQRILNLLQKGIEIDVASENLMEARRIGLETMGFFLTGVPTETDEDVSDSIRFAQRHFDYIVVDTLTLYPGTPLYDKYGHLAEFRLSPYLNRFKDLAFRKKAIDNSSRIYKAFYLSPKFLATLPNKLIKHPGHISKGVSYVLKHVLN